MLVTSSGWTTARSSDAEGRGLGHEPEPVGGDAREPDRSPGHLHQQRGDPVRGGVEPGPLREHAAEREEQRRAEGQDDFHAGGVCQAPAVTGYPVRKQAAARSPPNAWQPARTRLAPRVRIQVDVVDAPRPGAVSGDEAEGDDRAVQR